MDVEIETGILPHVVRLSHGVWGAVPKVSFSNVSSSGAGGGSLMRYHSAPSSVFAALLDEDFEPTSDDSEFARLLNDDIGSLSFLLDSKSLHQQVTGQPDFNAMAKQEDLFLLHDGNSNNRHPDYLGGGTSFPERLLNCPLSAISEYGAEATAKDFCLPLPKSEVAQQASVKPGRVDDFDYNSSCPESQATSVSFESAPILHSNFPADALSRSITDKNEDMANLEGLCVPVGDEKIAGQNIVQTHQPSMANSFADIKCGKTFDAFSSPNRSIALLRQSSSPAGLLSQINIEDFMGSLEKRPEECMPQLLSAEMMSNTEGLILGQCHSLGSRDENKADQAKHRFIELGQRKRGRALDSRSLKSLQRSPVDVATATMSSFTPSLSPGAGSSEHWQGPTEESVLCKARAKRGCATHPRSIAERQRRIKINERMKKLQDLVPNLDRQASTAEMLDEVVEYVKLLQWQVQELSLNHSKCTGSCQQGSSSPHR